MDYFQGLKAARAKCPNGHPIHLEVRPETDERLQPIQCPVCETDTVVFTGDLVGVLPE
jgi:hypothetical protein